jgi:hypothetical protein
VERKRVDAPVIDWQNVEGETKQLRCHADKVDRRGLSLCALASRGISSRKTSGELDSALELPFTEEAELPREDCGFVGRSYTTTAR